MTGVLHVGLFCFARLVHGGGFEEFLIRLANLLTARGHEVSVVNATPHEHRALSIALNIYYGNPLLHDNSRATTTVVRARLGSADLHEVPLWRMAGLLGDCDVIYAKNELLDLSILHTFRIARLPPVVCGVHTPLCYPRAVSRQARLHNALYLGRAYRVLQRGLAAAHVLNSYDASLLPRVHGWPPEHVFHIPHAYVPNSNGPPSRHASDGRPMRILWGARMTEQKGVETLVHILDALNGSAAASDYAFVIAGSGDPRLEAEVRSAAKRHDNVRYVGQVPHDDMPRLYDDADVALVTSDCETFGYSCLDPQARGLPVVASNIPGCADIVEHGVTGLLFRPGDVDAAVAAVRRMRDLYSTPGEFDAMRQRALRSTQERFDPTTINDSLEQMLLSVAARET
jgi:glycosyltransferase involved in cell wall biosynthesis